MNFKSKNSFQSLDKLDISGKSYYFYNLSKAEKNGLSGISKLPKSLKVLLENLLRFEDEVTVDKKQIKAVADWLKTKNSKMANTTKKKQGNKKNQRNMGKLCQIGNRKRVPK